MENRITVIVYSQLAQCTMFVAVQRHFIYYSIVVTVILVETQSRQSAKLFL